MACSGNSEDRHLLLLCILHDTALMSSTTTRRGLAASSPLPHLPGRRLMRPGPFCRAASSRTVEYCTVLRSQWYQEAVDYASLVPTHYEFRVYVPPQRLGDAGAYQKENRSSRSLLLRQPVAAKKSSLDSAK